MFKEFIQGNPLVLLLLGTSPNNPDGFSGSLSNQKKNSYFDFVYEFIKAQLNGKTPDDKEIEFLDKILKRFYPFSPEIKKAFIDQSAEIINNHTKNHSKVNKKILGSVIGLYNHFPEYKDQPALNHLSYVLNVPVPMFGKSIKAFSGYWLNPKDVLLRLDSGCFTEWQAEYEPEEDADTLRPLQDLHQLTTQAQNEPDALVIEPAPSLLEEMDKKASQLKDTDSQKSSRLRDPEVFIRAAGGHTAPKAATEVVFLGPTQSYKIIWLFVVACLSLFGYVIWTSNVNPTTQENKASENKEVKEYFHNLVGKDTRKAETDAITKKMLQKLKQSKQLEQKYQGGWKNPD